MMMAPPILTPIEEYYKPDSMLRDLPHLIPATDSDGEAARTHTDAINELLAAAGTALNRKRGKVILIPHLYIIRGDKHEKVGMEEATLPEFLAALCRMTKAQEVPTSWRPHLMEHIHQLCTMA